MTEVMPLANVFYILPAAENAAGVIVLVGADLLGLNFMHLVSSARKTTLRCTSNYRRCEAGVLLHSQMEPIIRYRLCIIMHQ